MRLLLRRFYPAGALCLLALLCAVALAAPKYLRTDGSSVIVSSINDSGPGTLRQAITDATDGDTIIFLPSLSGQTITLTTAQLVIDTSVTINGLGASPLTVKRDSKAPDFRVFYVAPGHTVEINDLTISGGRRADNGAGILNDQSTLTIASCTISGNTSLMDSGGGIYNSGTLTLVDSTVRSNQAFYGGNPNAGTGGGITNAGTMTIINGTVQSNFSNTGAGGIRNEGMMTITDSTITGNQSSGGHFGGYGGGIANLGKLKIQNSAISGNFAGGDLQGGSGGGISNGGALEILHSSIIGNRATNTGGGISGGCTITDSRVSNNETFRAPANGGGLSGDGFIITNCTIDINETSGDGGGIAGNLCVITNSTISGNTASRGGGFAGGGHIAHTTFSDNSASQGGSALDVSSPLELGHTILKRGSSTTTISGSGGGLTSLGYNLSSDDAAGLLTGPGDQINTDPLLGPLQNNGGPTFTHELLIGSPAINTGNPNFTPPPLYDQRGFGYVRVHNGRIDIGSFEAQPVGTISPTPTATSTATIPPPGPATHFTFVAPPDVIQFIPFTFTVIARDQFGKVALGYTGTVHFTSSDTGSGTQLPNDSTLTNGTGTFDVTLTTPDYQTITATDTLNPSITGTSGQILVFLNQSTPTPTPTPCTGTVIWSENFDGVTAPALPAGWVATNPDPGDGTLWVTSITTPDTAPNAAFIPGQDGISDKVLDSPPITIPNAISVLRFRNNFHTEFSGGTFCDGGVLEVSSPNISGGDFLDITDSKVGGSFLSGGYTGELCGPLAKRMAWVGDSGGYIDTAINLGPNLAGQTITLRFRFVSDEAVAAAGWRVDTMSITDVVCPTPTPTPTPTQTPTPTPTLTPAPAQSLNLSTRMLIQTGDQVGIGGFIIIGPTPKQVLLRAIGPSLAPFGVPDALVDPTLELHGPTGSTIATNDNWQDTQAAEIQATGLAPTNDLESAILVTLDPGNYTGIVKGKDDTTGVGLVEIYDLGPSDSQLGNISTRAFVGTGGNVLIGGFILGPGTTSNFDILASAPSGVNPALADPTLELRDSNGALLAFNDDCPEGVPLPVPPPGACINIPLPTGAYTAIVAGKNAGTGICLVEIYNLQ